MEEKTDVPTKLNVEFVSRQHFIDRRNELWEKYRGEYTDKNEWLAARRATPCDPTCANFDLDELAFLLQANLEESQAPAADALSLAADGLAEAVSNIAAFLVGNGDVADLAARRLRKALATYEAAKESR